MALQDQRQDTVLKKSYRSVILLLAIGGGGAGLVFLVITSRNGWLFLPSGRSSHPTEVVRIHSSTEPSHDPIPEVGIAGPNDIGHPSPKLSEPDISPGLPPPLPPGASYNPDQIRARIAAVDRGNLFGDHLGPVDVAGQAPQADRRAGPPAIAAEGNLITVHVQHLTAALTLDPVALQNTTAILAFPPDEMYRIEAPINGAGVMVNDQYVPPGGSTLVGTGSVIHLSGATDIHLRPSEPLKPPLGSG